MSSWSSSRPRVLRALCALASHVEPSRYHLVLALLLCLVSRGSAGAGCSLCMLPDRSLLSVLTSPSCGSICTSSAFTSALLALLVGLACDGELLLPPYWTFFFSVVLGASSFLRLLLLCLRSVLFVIVIVILLPVTRAHFLPLLVCCGRCGRRGRRSRAFRLSCLASSPHPCHFCPDFLLSS